MEVVDILMNGPGIEPVRALAGVGHAYTQGRAREVTQKCRTQQSLKVQYAVELPRSQVPSQVQQGLQTVDAAPGAGQTMPIEGNDSVELRVALQERRKLGLHKPADGRLGQERAEGIEGRQGQYNVPQRAGLDNQNVCGRRVHCSRL